MNGRNRTAKTKVTGSRVPKEKGALREVAMPTSPRLGDKRVLYFHTGTHKTGSTALQVYLALNKATLGSKGVGYEFPEGADQAMGNGQPFYEVLYGRRLRDLELEELLNFYLAGKPVGVCSSEDFTRFGQNEWKQIRDACQRIGVLVRSITFVRNIGPYYRSLHGQMVKGGEAFCSLDEFCTHDQYFPIMDSLRDQLEILGLESMSVIHYESSLMQLDKAFMSVLCLACDLFDRTPLQQTVNRSLTQYEQAVLSKVNQVTGRQYSYELSDLLMRIRPHLKEERSIEAEIGAKLQARHDADLKWVNSTFFGGMNVLKIQDAISNKLNDCALSLEDQQSIDQDVAGWALSKLQAAQDAGIDYIVTRLLAIDWRNAGNPAIPADFDPIAYLLLNRDVIRAAMPPYEHFIVAGQHEHERLWKWPDQ